VSTLGTIAEGYDESTDAEVALHWASSLTLTTSADVVVVHATDMLERLDVKQ